MACDGPCPDCPRRSGQPQSIEGCALWQAVLGLGGQIRVLSDKGGARVLGWDMTAALELAEAHGVPRSVAAELLPDIETVMVRSLSKSND